MAVTSPVVNTVGGCVDHRAISHRRSPYGVQVRRVGLGPPVGSYGWAGGLGSVWSNDPSHALVGVLLSTDAFGGPFPPPAVLRDFWTGAYSALDR